MRLKPGMEAKMQELMKKFEAAQVPGAVASYVYRMDADPNEFYLAVLFTDKAAYRANADSPEQDARYREMLQFLESEPEWHDGEVVAASTYAIQAQGSTAR
jgi:quinol monooxygenase YgiN